MRPHLALAIAILLCVFVVALAAGFAFLLN
jgi:hypothetical protein